MDNNYMTEQYMASILQQYQQNSPQKTSQNVSQNFCQLFENEEQNRRQLNESLFKSIDDSFERNLNQLSADRNRMTDTPMRVQQMVRNPVITSDSFKQPNPVNEQISAQNVHFSSTGAPLFRSQYYGQPIPQTRVRPQPYMAKVIDYSNGINEKPKLLVTPMPQSLRPVSVPTSVLTERNIYPMPPPIGTIQSVNALHSAISSIGQKGMPQRPAVPKPILKNSAQNMAFNRMAPNTGNDYQKPVPIPKSSLSIQSKATPERDTLLYGYENEGIIRTTDVDKNEAFYCFYCNTYFKKLPKVQKHCKNDFHRKNINTTIDDSLNNQLNKRFIFGQIAHNEKLESIGLTAETVFRMELHRIPPENKHYYYVKGIRLKNPGGPDAYYCRFCEQSIQSLANIESHLSNESHRKKENRITFSKFLSQTIEPIVGLQYITEYMSPDLLQPVYECGLCKCFEDAYDMYLHVCSFRHRLNLLKKFNPNEAILNSIKESPQAVKEIRKRITYLSQTVPTGAIVRVSNSPNFRKMEEQKRKKSDVEVIDITDDVVEQPSKLKKSLEIGVFNEEAAADAALIIQALKQSVVKYYLNKIPTHMRRVLINQVMEDEDVMDLDIRI